MRQKAECFTKNRDDEIADERHENEDSEEPVDDAWNRSQKLDQKGEDIRQLGRGHLGEKNG